MNKKSKGGKRPGAGRPPLSDAKENVPLRVSKSDIKKWGGKSELKRKLYEFIEFSRTIVELPMDYVSPKKISAVKSDGTAVKDITKPTTHLKPQEHLTSDFKVTFDRYAVLKEIEAIKAEKIPPERNTPFGKKVWQMDQQKRIQDLQSKLE